MQLQHVGILHKCIKRLDGFPKKTMVLVATLGIDVAPFCKCRNIKIRSMSHILEDGLTETKKIINLVPLPTKNIGYTNSTQLFNFPGKQQHKNRLFAEFFQFIQVHVSTLNALVP